MPPETSLPLDMLRAGEWADIVDVGGEAAWVCRMAELGLRAGCRIQVLQEGSPCLLRVAGCKLCLRGDDSAQILVRPVGAAVCG
jgi:ferrous iron transport protein A